jgi:hypothetical protein
MRGGSKIADTGHVMQVDSKKSIEIEKMGDWIATTQYIYAQSASYTEIPLGKYSYSHFSLKGNFQSESPYFRFGFKLLPMRAKPPLLETTIQEKGDELVLHIGKNTGRDELFFTVYRGGSRTGPDQPFLSYKDPKEIPIEISVSQNDVCTLIVDNVKLYEKQISHDIRERLLVVAWGDEHEYEVHFQNMRLRYG